jgi:hypothetical protein
LVSNDQPLSTIVAVGGDFGLTLSAFDDLVVVALPAAKSATMAALCLEGDYFSLRTTSFLFGLSAINHQYISPRTNQPPSTGQLYFSL